MPTFVASATKANVRQAAAGADRVIGTTSSAGNAGGTTVVDSAYNGVQIDFWTGKFLLLTSGTFSGQWRTITNFDASNGTYTVNRAYGGQVATSVTYEVYTLRPDLFTTAANRAIPALYPWVARPVLSMMLGASKSQVYGNPRNMRRPLRVDYGGSRALKDLFDRATSTTSAGGSWTATAGTWGIASAEKLYSVTDADADLLSYALNMPDGYIQAPVEGTLNSATVYRIPTLCFRVLEDYLGAIDTTNYLWARLQNGVVELGKVDGGTSTSLETATQTTTNGTVYLLGVQFAGSRVRVFVDDVLLIDRQLTGSELKYLAGKRIMWRLDKAGAPATNARVSEIWAFHYRNLAPLRDWRADPDRETFVVGAYGNALLSDGVFMVAEGIAPLSLLAVDTTYGTLASDTTATLEILTSDPEWELLSAAVRAEVYKLAQDPAWNGNIETIPLWGQREAAERAMVAELRKTIATPMPELMLKGPQATGGFGLRHSW